MQIDELSKWPQRYFSRWLESPCRLPLINQVRKLLQNLPGLEPITIEAIALQIYFQRRAKGSHEYRVFPRGWCYPAELPEELDAKAVLSIRRNTIERNSDLLRGW